MKNEHLNDKKLTRRDFSRLAMAALGGVVTGAAVGCDPASPTSTPPPAPSSSGAAPAPAAPAASGGGEMAMMMQEPHVCRGLNTCKGKGAGGANDCAGMGTCASAKKHDCHGHNECKGQGGCGETAGQNDCKGKGECSVPLSKGTWKKARAAFEAQAKAAGKTVGAAPAA